MDSSSPTVKMFLALAFLWSRKKSIVLVALAFGMVGAVYSLVATPVYTTRAVIYPKDVSVSPEKPALGGIGAALNPLAGNSHLNRVDVVLNSRDLARKVILSNNLLPELLPEKWSKEKQAWKGKVDSGGLMSEGAGRLQRMISTKPDVYKMTIAIRVNAPTAEFSYRVIEAYLAALNQRTKELVIRNAEANIEFLQAQMAKTMDPQTQGKMQELILREVETSMLLSASAFELLESPEPAYQREFPKRKRIVLISLVIGLCASCLGVLTLKAVKDIRQGAPA